MRTAPLIEPRTGIEKDNNGIVRIKFLRIARLASALEKVTINVTSFLGVLAEDTMACYGGLIQKLRTEAGMDKIQLTVFAATIVKNKSIFVYRMAVQVTSDTVTKTLAKLKTDIGALLAANRS